MSSDEKRNVPEVAAQRVADKQAVKLVLGTGTIEEYLRAKGRAAKAKQKAR
jgi:hypothetical protein